MFAVLELVTRMHGSIRLPGLFQSDFSNILGAFAFPCSVAAVSRVVASGDLIPLRILILEDRPNFAKDLISNITDLPLASNYIIDHESNVADALHKFSNSEQRTNVLYDSAIEQLNRTYDVVLIDLYMPMERGGVEDPQAGVRVFLFCSYVALHLSRSNINCLTRFFRLKLLDFFEELKEIKGLLIV
jgi:CheY-like chemotaxis protein